MSKLLESQKEWDRRVRDSKLIRRYT